MKKVYKSKTTYLILLAALAVAFGVVQAADLSKTYTIDYGPSGDKFRVIVQKGELQNAEFEDWINDVRDNYASSTAPTSPNAGQMWYDNSTTPDAVVKMYHAGTWVPMFSYVDTTTVEWVANIDAVNASIDNFEANTISAPYVDVDTADINTLTTTYATIGEADINTLNYSSAFKGVLLATTSNEIPAGAYSTISFATERYDTDAFHSAGSPKRITIPSGITYVRLKSQLSTMASGSSGNMVFAMLRNNSGNWSSVGGQPVIADGHDTTNIRYYSLNSPTIAVTAGDYFTVQVVNGTSNTLSLSAQADENWFSLEVVE